MCVKYNEQTSWEMKSGKGKTRKANRSDEKRERMIVDEESTHLYAFFTMTVGFLRVQIYKTDLKKRDKEGTSEKEVGVPAQKALFQKLVKLMIKLLCDFTKCHFFVSNSSKVMKQ